MNNYGHLTDKDDSLGHELHHPIRKVLNLIWVPFLNSLPPIAQKHVKKSDAGAKEIIDNATTHHAIEILYGKGGKHFRRNFKEKLFNGVWQGTTNAKAVRNRLRIVTRELTNEIKKRVDSGKEIKMLSIAAGSARADIDAIKNNLPIASGLSAVFLDKNPKAAEYSKKLSTEINAQNVKFEWVTDTIGNYFSLISLKPSLDIVEMVGLMDYFEDEKLVEVFGKIYKALNPGGVVVSANIIDNHEKKFVTKVIGWKMIYRSPSNFVDLIEKAGFEKNKIKVIIEPLKVHTVICATK